MTAALLAFVLKHETLIGWAAVLLGAALFGAIAAHRLEAPALTKAKADVVQAQAQVAAQAAATRMATAASTVVETARTRETVATATAQETTDALAHAPQADQPVPPDVLSAWLLASTACATRPPPPAPLSPIPVAQVLRDPCPRPDRPTTPTVGDLAAFSVRQEAALSVCEARKDAAVALIDAQAAASKAAK